jgi:YihY family inner membrane protein
MNAVTKAVGAVDRFQRRWPFLAFPVAVWKKFSDDQAGNLAALIAYYGFIATFPLLLVFVTVLDILLRNDPQLRATLIDSALAHYPVVGDQIKNNLGSFSGAGLPLAVGSVVLVLGARGVAGAMINALSQVWGIPRNRRPGFPLSWLYELALVLTVGIGFVVTTALSGVAAGFGHLLTGAGGQVLAVAVSLVLNVGVFWLAFRIATGFKVRWHDLRYGAAIAALVWQVLQVAGGYVVSHQLERASSLYGTFGVVLGLLGWLYLEAMVTLYAAEVDVVLVRRLWPRPLQPENPDRQEEEPRDEREAPHHGQRAA